MEPTAILRMDTAPFELDPGNTAWMLAAASLVLLMTPALAFFYGGMTRSKTVLNMMMMSFGVPATVAVGYQATFAIITVALISGAIADRAKFGTWLVFSGIWVTLVYSPIAHMVWGGGALSGGGFVADWLSTPIDFAGGTVVHINAGMAGFMLAIIIGKRKGFARDPMKPHNLPFVMLGAAVLWALAVGLKYKFGYDDSLDVVGVHLVGGIVGTVLIGFFANVTRDADGAVTSYTWAPDGALNGLFYGGGLTQLATQTVVALIAVLISGVMTLIIGYALKFTMGWRISDEDEVEGIDVTTHGESAYDIEPSSGSGGMSGVLTSPQKAQEVKA